MGFTESRGRTWDTLTELNTWISRQGTDQAGLDTDYAALTYDTGGGRTRGDFIVHMATMSTYTEAGYNPCVVLQGSKNSSFTTYVPLAIVRTGDEGAGTSYPAFVAEAQNVGWYVRPFDNDYGGTIYRYLRCYLYQGGTAQTGTVYRAYISKDAG